MPTILLLHRFPSASCDWHHQIKYFASQDYGIIAPDLLGYGGTSSPDSLEHNKFKNMSADIIEVLSECGVGSSEKVHVVGHDFSAIFMSTLIAYYPQIALTCSFLAVPYMPPGLKIDLGAMKQLTERELGFEIFGYRRFLMRNDSWKLIDAHKEIFFTLMYGTEETMIKNFLPTGELEAWLKADRKASLQDWVTADYLVTRNRIFWGKAYRGPTDWYRSRFREHLGIDEELADIKSPPPKLPCPTLYVQSENTKIMAKDWTERTRLVADVYEYADAKGGTGRWLQPDVPNEVNRILKGVFERHIRA